MPENPTSLPPLPDPATPEAAQRAERRAVRLHQLTVAQVEAAQRSVKRAHRALCRLTLLAEDSEACTDILAQLSRVTMDLGSGGVAGALRVRLRAPLSAAASSAAGGARVHMDLHESLLGDPELLAALKAQVVAELVRSSWRGRLHSSEPFQPQRVGSSRP